MTALTDSRILAVVRDHVPALQAVYLFGSRAQGSARADSDIDVAVLVDGKPDSVALWDAAQAIAIALDTDVDLIDMRQASTVLQAQILQSGRRLHSTGSAVDHYEMFILAEKLALDAARGPLLADIEAEGRVYGR